MKVKKDLQKLTETESRFKLLLMKKKIKSDDLEPLLTIEEKYQFTVYLTKLLNEKKGEELDQYVEQISEIIPQSVKNQLWENNHYKITVAITKLMEDHGKMPTKNMIADETGLSRQTIHKHLKDYATHSLYAEEMRKFKFMSDRVLAKVYKYAMNGEVKAARLYFEVMGNLGNQSGLNSTINTQNNYIQINQTKLSQETIKYLSPEQLNQIEAVLQSVPKVIPQV